MTSPNAGDPGNQNEPNLPRRDYLLLPLLGLLTICLLVGTTELMARRMFPVSTITTLGEDCIIFNDYSTGPRGIPNCARWEKFIDTELTEYRFNSCGHRAGMECRPKAPGTYRIVLLGDSVAMGLRVPMEQTFAALLPAELSRRTGRKIEVYDEGIPWRPPHILALHFEEVLAAKPDMVLWILTPANVGDESNLLLEAWRAAQTAKAGDSAPGKSAGFLAVAAYRVKTALASNPIMVAIRELRGRQSSGSLLRHLLNKIQPESQYVKSYLMRGDDAEFLKAEPSPAYQTDLKQFESYAAEMEAKARAANVPLVAVLLPNHAQLAMISAGEWPAGYDPYKFDDELRVSVVRHGGIYLDILPGLRGIPHPEQYYYEFDGHPNAKGHAVFTKLLANVLTSGGVPALSVSTRQQSALEPEK
jgi:hypothetical protein